MKAVFMPLRMLLAVAVMAMLMPGRSQAVAAQVVPPPLPVAVTLQSDLNAYLKQRHAVEHISAVSLTVSLANRKMIDVTAGTTEYDGHSAVTAANLFQIGSNTKAFTGVLALMFQSRGMLTLSQTIGDWLPQYPSWKQITVRQLLDMTSGIATYDGKEAMEAAMSQNPYRFFTAAELIGYVSRHDPLARGWLYSNTGYLLTQLILEKASKSSYTDLLRTDVIVPTAIRDVYYYPNIYPAQLRARTVAGYYENTTPEDKGLAPLLGKNVRDYSLSWTQAAGGIVATPHAVALWARELYQGTILTVKQRAEMESLVSTKTANPIEEVSANDPLGFGLGVSRMYKPGLGAFWFYEGETLGYRMVHAYFPKQDVVIAVGLNSQPVPQEDHVGELLQAIVKTLQANRLF
jgi:D-alanyl-D-alanine carboxypeptidase